jgi:hypothetical protein
MRKLKDGTEVPELDKTKTLEVKTKCPQKWKLIDLETGEEYIGWHTDGPRSWRRVDDIKNNA